MTHVVIDNCQTCLLTDCVEVCPVQCFYVSEEDKMLYIHPGECIDCMLCVPECPVQAIFAEDDLPEDKEEWTQINADKSEAGDLECITEKRDPLPTAEEKRESLGM